MVGWGARRAIGGGETQRVKEGDSEKERNASQRGIEEKMFRKSEVKIRGRRVKEPERKTDERQNW